MCDSNGKSIYLTLLTVEYIFIYLHNTYRNNNHDTKLTTIYKLNSLWNNLQIVFKIIFNLKSQCTIAKVKYRRNKVYIYLLYIYIYSSILHPGNILFFIYLSRKKKNCENAIKANWLTLVFCY